MFEHYTLNCMMFQVRSELVKHAVHAIVGAAFPAAVPSTDYHDAIQAQVRKMIFNAGR